MLVSVDKIPFNMNTCEDRLKTVAVGLIYFTCTDFDRNFFLSDDLVYRARQAHFLHFLNHKMV